MDDVPIVDHVAVFAVTLRPAARQGHQWRRADEQFQSVVIQADSQAMSDEARGYRVEDLAQREAT